MKNYVKPGETMTLTAPYARNSGEGALVGALFGVATTDIANGAEGEFLIQGVVTLAKATGTAWTLGALLYWSDANKNVTTVSTSNTRIGCAAKAAASGDTSGTVRLNGQAAPTGA